MTDWPELHSMWEMNWGAPRGTEKVRVIEHAVPLAAVCIEAGDGITWVPLDVFHADATPAHE
jgi:hypothetical protein